MKITRDFSNKLLKRRELEVIIEEASNPGFAKVKEELVKEFKAKEDLVIVKKVESGFGSGMFKVDAFIYEDKETMGKVEPKKKEKKKAGGS